MSHPRTASLTLGITTLVAGVALLFLATNADPARSDNPLSETDSECLDCHDMKLSSLMGTSHDMSVGTVEVSCLSCHPDAADEHLDDDEILPFNAARQGVSEAAEVCLQCHATFHTANQLERDPHNDPDINCTGCHKVHDNDHIHLLADEQPGLCYRCHASVEGDFFEPFRHPVEDHVMKCSDCHIGLFQSPKQHDYSGTNTPCYECHGRFQGPYPFQHFATVDYSTEEGGCINCHAPHGSDQPRMLKQPYDVANQALCSSCHFVPRHENNSNHGTQWAGVPCSDCHVDIHGSYDNRNFLRPSMRNDGCFNAGCHAY